MIGRRARAATVSYINVPAGRANDPAYCKGTRTTGTIASAIPVLPYSGAAFALQTTALTVDKAAPSWVNLVVRGLKPAVGNFRAAITAPKGLVVEYPGGGSSTGLNSGDILAVGYDDFVAIRLDASGLAAGTYSVPVKLTFTAGTTAGVPAKSKVSAAVAEALYVKLAAKRLATVQARPFRTAADLQRAYRSVEAVSGLTVDQIRQFDKRVVTDRVLAARVSREFKATYVKAARR